MQGYAKGLYNLRSGYCLTGAYRVAYLYCYYAYSYE